jgi:hypothetical protein
VNVGAGRGRPVVSGTQELELDGSLWAVMVVAEIVETTAESAMRKVTRLAGIGVQIGLFGGRSAHAYGQCGLEARTACRTG